MFNDMGQTNGDDYVSNALLFFMFQLSIRVIKQYSSTYVARVYVYVSDAIQ